jgi:hypothetical protein
MHRILFYISIASGAFLLFAGCPSNPGAGQGQIQVMNYTVTNVFNISYAGIAIGTDTLTDTNAPGLTAGDSATVTVNPGSAYVYFTACTNSSFTGYQNYISASQIKVSGGLTTFFYISPGGPYNSSLCLVKIGDQSTVVHLVPVK